MLYSLTRHKYKRFNSKTSTLRIIIIKIFNLVKLQYKCTVPHEWKTARYCTLIVH